MTYGCFGCQATILKPHELNVPADKFKGQFGIEWQAALDSGKVMNAMDGCVCSPRCAWAALAASPGVSPLDSICHHPPPCCHTGAAQRLMT